ncbi:MAG: ribbon-helix-helix protein, CopG family [Acidobacteria bacterium]|nr:ribbon-helix-helix protein, CopG family [Acidobacteriota bacterium]
MCMLNRRLQILIDEEGYERLARLARHRGTSVASVVREAIDIALPAVDARKAGAGRAILAADSMPVPSPAELRRELESLRERRR